MGFLLVLRRWLRPAARGGCGVGGVGELIIDEVFGLVGVELFDLF